MMDNINIDDHDYYDDYLCGEYDQGYPYENNDGDGCGWGQNTIFEDCGNFSLGLGSGDGYGFDDGDGCGDGLGYAAGDVRGIGHFKLMCEGPGDGWGYGVCGREGDTGNGYGGGWGLDEISTYCDEIDYDDAVEEILRPAAGCGNDYGYLDGSGYGVGEDYGHRALEHYRYGDGEGLGCGGGYGHGYGSGYGEGSGDGVGCSNDCDYDDGDEDYQGIDQ